MNVAKAPAGGTKSLVNGQWYEGGEFIPVHGLFCGKAGEKRSAKWEKAKTANKAKDLGGDKFFEVTEYSGGGVWVIVGYVIANSSKEAEAAFTAKTKLYAKQV